MKMIKNNDQKQSYMNKNYRKKCIHLSKFFYREQADFSIPSNNNNVSVKQTNKQKKNGQKHIN